MNYIRASYIAVLTVLAIVLLWSEQGAFAGPLDETRCCVAEIRYDADGKISRRADVLRAFRDLYPCPATGQTRGRCENWEIQHLIPLKCRGRDIVGNLYWLPSVLKSGPGYLPVDRWEMDVYCTPRNIVQMPKRQRLHLENHQ